MALEVMIPKYDEVDTINPITKPCHIMKKPQHATKKWHYDKTGSHDETTSRNGGTASHNDIKHIMKEPYHNHLR